MSYRQTPQIDLRQFLGSYITPVLSKASIKVVVASLSLNRLNAIQTLFGFW